MSIFDGQTFIGFDDDAVGENEPLDTLAHHVFRAQADFNIRRGARVAHAPYSERGEDASGERVYASVGWASPFVRRIMVEPRCEAIRLHLLGRVSTRDGVLSTTNDPVIDARLIAGGLGRVETTWTETTGFEALSLELAVAAPPARREVREISLWTRSILTEPLSSTSTGTHQPGEDRDLLESLALYPIATYPGPDTYADQATRMAGVAYDHLYQPAKDLMLALGRVDPSDLWTRWSLSWLAIRGIWFEMDHAPRVFAAGDIVGADMRAGIVEESEVITSHAQAALARYRGARIHSLGPRGGYGQGGADQDAYGYPLVWGWTDANEAGEGFGGATLCELTTRVDEDDPRITLRLLLAATHAVPDDASATLAALVESSATCPYTLTLSVLQLSDTNQDPTELATVNRDVVLDHLPTSDSGVWPLLRQARWRHEGNVTHDAPTYHEGQVYEADRELLRDVEVSVDVTGVDLDHPVIVRAVLTRADDPTYRASSVEEVDELDRLQIITIGAVVEESHP